MNSTRTGRRGPHARPVAAMIGALLLGGATAAVVALAPAGQANAVTLPGGGSLTITAPTALTLTTSDASPVRPGSNVTGTTGNITVTDARNDSLSNWDASVSIKEFTGTRTGGTFAPDVKVIPTTATLTGTGTAAVTPAQATALHGTPQPVQKATQVTSTVATPVTATWTETIQFTIPPTALADTYTATLTHSVS
ncbi:hypothetical protein OIT41_20285 (plasmid) [Arthrobacter sp. YA7-1]|uniref:hypothetical protein n=1 Tax=Arthrobacter sp. YA7-1 TaxID=2987701 RepID=UPI002227F5AC|nr:hypothetical protein [Arthrobacter sp. YA7-1]UYY83593.1 hypothetical protein OIT41_20285 [Arthrobacter sp. YA7-1]